MLNRTFGLALVNLPAVAALTLGLLGFGFLGWLGACACGVLIGALWYRRFAAAAIAIATLVSSALAPIPVSAFMVDAVRVAGGMAPRLSLGELRSRADGELVQVEAADTRPEFVGVEDTPTSANVKMDRRECAVPVVPARWNRTESVTYWLTCAGRPAACQALWHHRPILGTVRRRDVDESEAIRNALSQHGISAPAQVITLHSSSSPRLDAWVLLAGLLVMFLVLNAVMQAGITWAKRR